MSARQASVSLNGGLVVLACVSSAIGVLCTFRLVRNRSGHRGLFNWLHLIGASLALGIVGIWCTHFMDVVATQLTVDGMTAVAWGEASWIAGSFFYSIVVSFLAFVVAADPDHAELWRIRTGALLMAASMLGTHFLANKAISYQPVAHTTIDQPGLIALAVVLVVVATQFVWALFFHFQSRWKADLRVQLVCSVLLAGTINAMHFILTFAYSFQVDDAAGDDVRCPAETRPI